MSPFIALRANIVPGRPQWKPGLVRSCISLLVVLCSTLFRWEYDGLLPHSGHRGKKLWDAAPGAKWILIELASKATTAAKRAFGSAANLIFDPSSLTLSTGHPGCNPAGVLPCHKGLTWRNSWVSLHPTKHCLSCNCGICHRQ